MVASVVVLAVLFSFFGTVDGCCLTSSAGGSLLSGTRFVTVCDEDTDELLGCDDVVGLIGLVGGSCGGGGVVMIMGEPVR